MSKIKLSDHFEYGPTTVTYQQLSPDCDILVNKQKRKIYGKNKNKVYLNNGDNIQINLFNPLYHRIGVQLEFNGEKEEKMLILNPGQKVLLDRFIDTKKKIKFGTYFIDGSNSAAKEAIKKNGNIKVHFWYEKMKQSTIYLGSNWSDSSGVPFSSNTGYQTFSNTGAFIPYSGSITTTNTNTNTIYSNYLAENLDKSINYSNYIEPKLEETGRIEKGDKSKQKMKETEFEADKIFYVKEFKLLPFSKMKDDKKKNQNDLNNNFKPKSVTVGIHNNYRNTDHRIYCSNPMCGYRVRNQSWRFCPICGSEIE